MRLEVVMSLAMPSVWVALLVIAIICFVFLLLLSKVIPPLRRATKEHEQQPAEVQQKQPVAPVRKKKGKKSRKREKAKEQAEARSGQSQNYTSKMEEQGDEMSQQIKDDDMLRETVTAPTQQCEKRDQHFNHQLRTKDVEFQHVEVKWKHLEGSPAQNKTKYEEEIANLKEENANLKEENANLKEENANNAILKEENAILKEKNANFKEEIAELKQDRKAQDEQRVPKLEQVSRAKEASSEQVQPGGEDQTGVSANHASKPVAREGGQPRIRSDTLGMEQEVPRPESETTTSKMAAARTKRINSEDENKFVEEGLKKVHQSFSRKNSFSSEATVPLVDLSGVMAEGRQPLSYAKDATITTQIDKEINKKPTDIESKVPSNHDLEVRQLVSVAAPLITQWDKKIEPNLEKAALSGVLPKSKYPFSKMSKALLIIILEKPNNSDINNREWLERHHLLKFWEESGNWLNENLDPRKAKETLNILEEAATISLGNVGRLLVPLYKKCVRTNHQVHPILDPDKMILYSNEGTYTSDGEDLREVVQLMAGELKKQPVRNHQQVQEG